MNFPIQISFGDFKINRVIKNLIISDMMFLGAWGLIAPIFAVFVMSEIKEATLVTVGAAAALYWIVKSVVQIPVAIYVDKHEGEKDDFHALVFSLMLVGFSGMAFVMARTIPTLFVVQFIHAVGMGFFVPSWSALFSRHLDKGKYAFDWSLNSTFLGVAHGAAAFFGGIIADLFGFSAVFILVSVLSFASAFVLFSIPHLIFPKAYDGRKTNITKDQHLPPSTMK